MLMGIRIGRERESGVQNGVNTNKILVGRGKMAEKSQS